MSAPATHCAMWWNCDVGGIIWPYQPDFDVTGDMNLPWHALRIFATHKWSQLERHNVRGAGSATRRKHADNGAVAADSAA